ncbi:MAG: phage terminase large subunit [Bacteroidota bacterium]
METTPNGSLASSAYSAEWVRSLPKQDRQRLARLTTPKLTRYIPHAPTVPQTVFLLLPNREALYGGAAGGGKSDALLMGALQYVDTPGYSAIVFRRTYKDLALPDAIMDRSHQWLGGTDAKWDDQEHTWRFPAGATLTFGYLDNENDKFRYQGAAFQYIGFDELTQFTLTQYTYLFSRLRRLEGARVPLRMRSASNPGGLGHEWVRQRFLVEGRIKGRVFVPAKLQDNPYLDQEEYLASLAELDPVTRAQLLNGDWTAKPEGNKFRREWLEIVDAAPAGIRKVRYWDLAATEPKPGKDPDWTVGALVGEKDGVYYICDIRRTRTTPRGVEALIKQTANLDSRAVEIYMEQEPGSSGVNTIDHYAREVLKGYAFRGNKATGSKEVRANPVSAAVEAGNVKLVRGPWISDFLDEIEAFPFGPHDDQVDAVSGAFEMLAGSARGTMETGYVDI